MRLTAIKLNGFKSFAEATHLSVSASLVAVVGPNGCGKSNVMDAVRWVLGESSARQLRGDSMQDVIFNGSLERKPAPRASVELIFDNSDGKLSGAWNRFAELSIRRVLTRSGESSYWINGQQVRRRDITELFLGTGVGARGYAVIEQGMIARLIEARPEELRAHLEEAAGISKYRERRRETEARLKDTRDHLARLFDVQVELMRQIEKLDEQANIAQQYQSIQAKLLQTQNYLALFRKQEAQQKEARYREECATLLLEIEALQQKMTARTLEYEQLQEQLKGADEALNHAQTQLSQATTVQARFEEQLRHQRELKQRAHTQYLNAKRTLEQLSVQKQQHFEAVEATQAAFELAREHLDNLPKDERLAQEVVAAQSELERVLQQLEQAHMEAAQARQQLELARQTHQHVEQRRQHLTHTLDAHTREIEMLTAQGGEVEAVRELFEQSVMQLEASHDALDTAQEAEQYAEEVFNRAHAVWNDLEAQRLTFSTQMDTLSALLPSSEPLEAWLAQHSLSRQLYTQLEMNDALGWGDSAVWALLSVYLDAYLTDGAHLPPLTPPPASVSMMIPFEWEAQALPDFDLAVQEYVQCVQDTQTSPNLFETLTIEHLVSKLYRLPRLSQWIERGTMRGNGGEVAFEAMMLPALLMVCVPSEQWLYALCAHCPLELTLVTQDGSWARRGVVHIHRGTATIEHTWHVQSRLMRVNEAQDALNEPLLEAQRGRDRALMEWEQAKRWLEDAQQAQKHAEHHHAAQKIEWIKAVQAEHARSEQLARLGEERERLVAEFEALTAQEWTQDLGALTRQFEQLEAKLSGARTQKLEAQTRLTLAQTRDREAERVMQEAKWALSHAQMQHQDAQRQYLQLEEREMDAQAQLNEWAMEYEQFDLSEVEAQLFDAMHVREQRQDACHAAREAVHGVQEQLRQWEWTRKQSEAAIEPLREQLRRAELNQQEAALTFSRFQEALREVNVDEAMLFAQFPVGKTAAQFSSEIQSLTQQIQAFGAVNLAALEELNASKTRAQYVQQQVDDVTQAVEMLTQAMTQIDEETRQLLSSTFAAVNASMGRIFPVLFGGGRAELSLTGDDILTSGVQIMAQPTGKKNTTIHLLSGGEKALTAMSLVFALFELRPAPFCLLDEVDAPLDDANTGRFCKLVQQMAGNTQFLYISHNRLTMEMAQQLVGVTMQEKGVSRVVEVELSAALEMREA